MLKIIFLNKNNYFNIFIYLKKIKKDQTILSSN
jgi:hypothetical protein